MAERTRRSRSAASPRRGTRSEAGGSGRLNRDYSEEEYREPGEGYNGPEPTKGLYTCELVSINDHTKKDEDEPSSVKWLFRLAPGSETRDGEDCSGWHDSIYTTDNTLWREQQMLVALGVIKPGGKVNLPYDGIVKKAKACTVRVGTERYIPEDGGDPEWRGRMQAFLPLRDATASKASGRRRPKDEDEGEDVFEDGDDTDAEDEDEEDEPNARPRRSTSRSRRKAAEPEPEEDDEDEPDEEEEDYDPDALAAELEDLTLPQLKKRARDEFGVTIKRGMDADAIIDAVLDTLGDEDEDEDDEEEPPPPPKRSSRSRTAGKATTTRRKRGSSDEPPF